MINQPLGYVNNIETSSIPGAKFICTEEDDEREDDLPNEDDAEPEDSDYFMDDSGRIHINLDYWGD